MLKKYILCIAMFMTSAMPAQPDNDALIKTVVALTTATVAGYSVWYVLSPAEQKDIAKINAQLATHEHNLQKYRHISLNSYRFDEQEFITMLTQQLECSWPYANIQTLLQEDLKFIHTLQNSIWLGSFFYTSLAEKYQDLELIASNIRHIQNTVQKHQAFFNGWKIYQKYSPYAQTNGTVEYYIHTIRFNDFSKHQYPLVNFVEQGMKDVLWIESLHHNLYPHLSSHLQSVNNFIKNLCIQIKSTLEYKSELQAYNQWLEQKRLQEIAESERIKAEAAERQAYAAARKNEIEHKRLQLAKEENERRRIEKRVQELRRLGHSDRQIQSILNQEQFTRDLINLFFGIE